MLQDRRGALVWRTVRLGQAGWRQVLSLPAANGLANDFVTSLLEERKEHLGWNSGRRCLKFAGERFVNFTSAKDLAGVIT
jgi:hypothetical protein